MGKKTNIEWTKILGEGASWNFIAAFNRDTGKRGWFCVKKNSKCAHCYAETLNTGRLGNGLAYAAQNLKHVDLKLIVDHTDSSLDAPLRWRRPRGIFPCSMTDLFGEFVPEAWIGAAWTVMDLADQHIFMTLTKRPARMIEFFKNMGGKAFVSSYVPDEFVTPFIKKAVARKGGLGVFPPPHIWIGVSIGDQEAADETLPYMHELRAILGDGATLWVSNEPSLGKVNWRGWEGLINWMVSGGESGPKARPTHPDAIRADRDWCVANGVPFFFKQWGQFDYRRIIKNTVGTCIETPNGYVTINAAGITPLDDRYAAVRVADKHRAGNELDGQTWAQFPPLPSGSLTLPPSVEHALRERS